MFCVGTLSEREESSQQTKIVCTTNKTCRILFTRFFKFRCSPRVEKLSFSCSFTFWANELARIETQSFLYILPVLCYTCVFEYVYICALVGLGYLHTWSHYSRVIGPKFQGEMKIGRRAHTAKIAHKSHQISPRGDDEYAVCFSFPPLLSAQMFRAGFYSLFYYFAKWGRINRISSFNNDTYSSAIK